MTSRQYSSGINRRVLLSTLAVLPIPVPPLSTPAPAQEASQLPSWNDGPAKEAILKFVAATTDPASPDFVPPQARIAEFDLVHPLYTQIVYCLDRSVRSSRRSRSLRIRSRSKQFSLVIAKRSPDCRCGTFSKLCFSPKAA